MSRLEIIRGPPVEREPDILACPRCIGGWLHQSKVTIFERREDATTLEVVVSAQGQCATQIGGSGANPSARRNAVVIQFWCEFCGDHPDKAVELVFAQHKGQTETYWRYDGTGVV